MKRALTLIGKVLNAYEKAFSFLFLVSIVGLMIFVLAKSGASLINCPIVDVQLSLTISLGGAAIAGFLVLLRVGFTLAAIEAMRLFLAVLGPINVAFLVALAIKN